MRMDRARSDGPVVSGLSAAGFRVDDNVYRALAIAAHELKADHRPDFTNTAPAEPTPSREQATSLRPAAC